MAGTQVTYHVEDGHARPAINVKHYGEGWPLRSEAVDRGLDYDAADEIHEQAYESVVARFWADAAILADELGLGAIEQEGRSGGWLVLADPRLTGLLEDAPNGRRAEAREFAAGYDALRRWCEDYIGRATVLVPARAQSLAIERVSSAAVARMFGAAA